MWKGKPVEKWTPRQKAMFLNYLTGHSYSPHYYFHTDHGFQTVKDFMESQMAETWEKHLLFVASNVNTECKKRLQYKLYFTKVFNAQLSLDNLITFLLDNQEWAWKECPICSNNPDGIIHSCCKCDGTGQIKHPALTWAEGLK